MQLYAELTELTLQSPEPVPHRHLLVQPVPYTDSETPRQASSLLTAALREGIKGQVWLQLLILEGILNKEVFLGNNILMLQYKFSLFLITKIFVLTSILSSITNLKKLANYKKVYISHANVGNNK